ncbi:MAG: DNA-deoxyinosine glycosylase [Oscillospiraceae bacterium]|nr:DNA-deoxyinosine glycosylase [Oscillospiraceae bacterium]
MNEKTSGQWDHVVHGFDPIWDERSRVLVLGTLPSVKSREENFYYGHPRNRFWKLLALLFDAPEPRTAEEKKTLLLENGVALWDVVRACDIRRSADGTIRNAAPNDIRPILAGADIRAIYTNGVKAKELYDRLLLPMTGREARRLPSTSPANAALSLDELAEAWRVIKEN